MDTSDFGSAQQVVAAYATMLERHAAEERYPGTLSDLPYPKTTIRSAFQSAVPALAASEQLTPELRDYLEVAYVSLADYIDDEMARLMREYREASEAVAADGRMAREKVASPAWQRMSATSKLAGDIAKAIAAEAAVLRTEFRRLAEGDSAE